MERNHLSNGNLQIYKEQTFLIVMNRNYNMLVINDNVAETLMLLNLKLTLTSAPQLFPNLIFEPVFPGLVLEVFQ